MVKYETSNFNKSRDVLKELVAALPNTTITLSSTGECEIEPKSGLSAGKKAEVEAILGKTLTKE